MDVALAVDVGGTKLAAAMVDRRGSVLVRGQVPTPRGAGPETLWQTLVDLLSATVAQLPGSAPVVVGVGCGGPMAPGGETVSPLNIAGWRAFPLRARLAAWSGLDVHIDNDAKALARAEGWIGAARGRRDFLAIVVSTGVGGGIVLDGRLLDGASGNAGHIGHLVVEPGGRTCACGARGCLEAEASGTAIRARYGVAAADAPVAARVRTGTLVGRAVASVATLVDLPLAVVAGSVALGYGPTFFEAAQAEVDRSCHLAYTVGTRILAAGLGGDGPLVGAAALGWAGLDADP